MTALADFPVAQAGPAAVPSAVPAADRSGAVRDHAKTIRSWPLLVLAVPAAAEVWSGWVGIAQKTGFGMVPLLPGIWSSLHLDTAVTLPVGVECYAAYALRAWLATGHAISDRTRRFARWSAICSFALGMAGQVTFHLMDQDHVTRAPWVITTLVSCLPVLVLGMGTTLAHMLREDASSGGPSGRPVRRTGRRAVPGMVRRAPVRGPSGPVSGSGPAGPGPGPAGRDQDHGPDQSVSEDQRLRALAGSGSTARCRRARHLQFPRPRRRSGILDCSQASHGRETRVPAGTAQRRGQGV